MGVPGPEPVPFPGLWPDPVPDIFWGQCGLKESFSIEIAKSASHSLWKWKPERKKNNKVCKENSYNKVKVIM